MKFKQFTFNALQVNTYLLWDETAKEAILIDSAMQTTAECAELQHFIDANGLTLTKALQTHTHFDHIFGVPFIHDTYGLTPLCHKDDKVVYDSLAEWLAQFGMRVEGNYPELDKFVNDNDIIKLGSTEIHVLHTPGHTPGGVSYYIPSEGLVFTGDTLFASSVGRTDFPGGNFEQELLSIRNHLLVLPDDTKVLPGHGPQSTIAKEKQFNPYF